ncbi:MAG: phycocyanin alpha phycocyanobilin lyase, partial [Planctomycetaceae bacterium]|nr:phycocyanin alpha phycocyanobilin lyase [Planctomycetaceae bacterium]
PKNLALGEFSRGGAIWALGHLHAGIPDEPLAQLMIERLTEPMGAIPPEATRVRVACAISLGRMQAKSQAARMRSFVGPNVGFDPTSMAIRWSIHELTGETLPDPERPVVSAKGNWFLEPLD